MDLLLLDSLRGRIEQFSKVGDDANGFGADLVTIMSNKLKSEDIENNIDLLEVLLVKKDVMKSQKHFERGFRDLNERFEFQLSKAGMQKMWAKWQGSLLNDLWRYTLRRIKAKGFCRDNPIRRLRCVFDGQNTDTEDSSNDDCRLIDCPLTPEHVACCGEEIIDLEVENDDDEGMAWQEAAREQMTAIAENHVHDSVTQKRGRTKARKAATIVLAQEKVKKKTKNERVGRGVARRRLKGKQTTFVRTCPQPEVDMSQNLRQCAVRKKTERGYTFKQIIDENKASVVCIRRSKWGSEMDYVTLELKKMWEIGFSRAQVKEQLQVWEGNLSIDAN